jgi:predicted phage gp36 major capsid-like protein
VNLGRLAKQVKRVTDDHGDKIAQAVDKATTAVDDRTNGRYKDKLSKVDEMARKLDKTGRSKGRDGGGIGGTNQAGGG